MPHLLDPRIITLSKDTRKIYGKMIEAEYAFCNTIGDLGFQHEDNRQKLIFSKQSFNVSRVRKVLGMLEEWRENYLASAKADEQATRDNRPQVGTFDTIADQSTQPPRLITRTGSVAITSANLEQVVELLKDPADFVKFQQKVAYRIGRLTLQEALDEIAGHIRTQLFYIENSEKASNYERARRQEAVLRGHEETQKILRQVAARADADGLHVRIRSGIGTRFRARFPGIDDGKWLTVPFTVANVAVIGVADRGLRGVHNRTRETRFERIAVAGIFEVFEEKNLDD